MSKKRIPPLSKELDNKEKNENNKIDDTACKQPEDKLKEKKMYVLNAMENRTGMQGRLKRLGLTIDSVAYIVAFAMIEKERHDRIIASSKEAKEEKETAGRDLRSAVKKIKDVFGKPFIEEFFKQRIAHPYFKAAIKKTLSDDKKSKLGKTRPKQKYFDRFCIAFSVLFASSGKSPNSRLIADIANLFDLTDKPQNSETIRTRIQRLL
ncbi:MAG: hypothetical protein U9N83_01680 [Thermodesulfobacteriota bacterium]|nr:hypothetical protein [Thermodesulfobacteriota bacterium]